MWNHRSVVQSVSERQVYFFDSYKIKHLNRSRCTAVRSMASRPHAVPHAHLFSVKLSRNSQIAQIDFDKNVVNLGNR
jgi:hypothetical protein